MVMVDLSKEFGASKTGKLITIASTEGDISVPGREEVKIGVNVYRKSEGGEVSRIDGKGYICRMADSILSR